MNRREFVELVGPDAGPAIALARCPHLEIAGDVSPLDEQLRRRRPNIAREPVSPQAERSFDAAAHLAVAIELAGPDREAVRQTRHRRDEVCIAVGEGAVGGDRQGEKAFFETQRFPQTPARKSPPLLGGRDHLGQQKQHETVAQHRALNPRPGQLTSRFDSIRGD